MLRVRSSDGEGKKDLAKHKITFQPMGVTVEVDPSEYPYGREGCPGSVLDIALANGVDIDHNCGGQGVCGSCHVIATQGADNLSEADADELDVVELVPANALNSRLACQAVVNGDVVVTVPNWKPKARALHGTS